jgi:hypothetical protein
VDLVMTRVDRSGKYQPEPERRHTSKIDQYKLDRLDSTLEEQCKPTCKPKENG